MSEKVGIKANQSRSKETKKVSPNNIQTNKNESMRTYKHLPKSLQYLQKSYKGSALAGLNDLGLLQPQYMPIVDHMANIHKGFGIRGVSAFIGSGTLQRMIDDVNAAHSSSGVDVQTKLTVSNPGDKYEKEADKTADHVMGMNVPEPDKKMSVSRTLMKFIKQNVSSEEKKDEIKTKIIPEITPLQRKEEEKEAQEKPLLQRIESPEEKKQKVETKSISGIMPLQRREEEKEAQEKPIIQPIEFPEDKNNDAIQTKRDSGMRGVALETESKIRDIQGKGHPLPDSERKFFEPRFGMDFGNVRVHKGSESADLTKSVQARAFTVGSDIVFGQGEYNPDTEGGKRLLAHELTHTIQQGAVKTQRTIQKKEENRNNETVQTLSQTNNEMVNETETENVSIQNREIKHNSFEIISKSAEKSESSASIQNEPINTSFLENNQNIDANQKGEENRVNINMESDSRQEGGSVTLLDNLKDLKPSNLYTAFNQIQEQTASALNNERNRLDQGLPRIPSPTGLRGANIEREAPLAASKENIPIRFKSERTGRREINEMNRSDKQEKTQSPIRIEKMDIINNQNRINQEENKSAVQRIPVDTIQKTEEEDPRLQQRTQHIINTAQLDMRGIQRREEIDYQVNISGEADPNQLNSFQNESDNMLNNSKANAYNELRQDFGESRIRPQQDNTILQSNRKLSRVDITPVNIGEQPNISPDIAGGFNQSLGQVLSERISQRQEEFQNRRAEYQTEADTARNDANTQIIQMNEETRERQLEEQERVREEVQQNREQWRNEVNEVDRNFQERSSQTRREYSGVIEQERRDGETRAAQHIREGEERADSEVRRAENQVHDRQQGAQREARGVLGWIRSKAESIVNGLRSALNTIFDGLRRAVRFIFEQAKRLATAAIELARRAIVAHIRAFGMILRDLVNVVFAAFPEIRKKIIQRINSAIDRAERAVNAAADLLKRGVERVLDALAAVVDTILKGIQRLYDLFLQGINALIRLIADLMKRIGFLVEAARQVPDHFFGQMTEEVLGMNLSEPLAIERSRSPLQNEGIGIAQESGGVSLQDRELFNRQTLNERDIEVDNIPQERFDSDFINSFNLAEGEEREFGEISDPSHSIEAIRAEMMESSLPTDNLAARGQVTGSERENIRDEQSAEIELQRLMAQEPEGTCTKEKSGEPAREGDIPEHMKIGPLTVGQRARYMVHQMRKGISTWFSCNWPWLVAAAVAALVGFIALNIVTGGAVLAALPLIMQIVGAIMIGVALGRVMSFVRDYLTQGWDGKIIDAGKSLARALAIGAVELIFALLFNMGTVIKTLRTGLRASVRTAVRAAKATVTTTIRNVRELGRIGLRAGRALVRNGKLLMTGLRRGFSRGVRSLDDLARRLWRAVRFRKFKITRRGLRFQIWGFINPWVLLADGSIEEVHFKGGRPELGEVVHIPGRRGRGIVIGVWDENTSKVVKEMLERGQAERKALYESLITQSQNDIRRLIANRETTYQLRKGISGIQPPHFQAHHIIPRELKGNRRINDFLEKIGFGLEDGARNGIMLPNRTGHGVRGWKNATIHRGSHPDYTKRIRDELTRMAREYDDLIRRGRNRENLNNIFNQRLNQYLNDIKNGLMSGGINLN